MQALSSVGPHITRLAPVLFTAAKIVLKVAGVALLIFIGVFAFRRRSASNYRTDLLESVPKEPTVDKANAEANAASKRVVPRRLSPIHDAERIVSPPTVSPSEEAKQKAFMDKVKGQSFEALFGKMEIDKIPICKADSFQNLQLEHLIEKGITENGLPFIAVQVHYELTTEDITRLQLESKSDESVREYIQRLLLTSKGNAHVIFYQSEVKKWDQVKFEVPYPSFFHLSFSPGKEKNSVRDFYKLFRELLEKKECQDYLLEFKWKLGHK